MKLPRFLSSLALVGFAVACSSSGTGPGDAGFVPHAPSSHITVAVKCTSHPDAGVTDPCTTAADCPAGQGCMCGELFPGNASVKQNACMPAQCEVDADCGANGYCSRSIVPLCGPNGVDGFYCHTPLDECDDPSDCASTDVSCTWIGDRWACVPAECAG